MFLPYASLCSLFMGQIDMQHLLYAKSSPSFLPKLSLVYHGQFLSLLVLKSPTRSWLYHFLILSFSFQRSVHNISHACRIYVLHHCQCFNAATLSCLILIFLHILHFGKSVILSTKYFTHLVLNDWSCVAIFNSSVFFFRHPFFIHSQLLLPSLTYSVTLINKKYILFFLSSFLCVAATTAFKHLWDFHHLILFLQLLLMVVVATALSNKNLHFVFSILTHSSTLSNSFPPVFLFQCNLSTSALGWNYCKCNVQ